MVRDIVAGEASSYPFSLTNVNGTLFFVAGDFMSGLELWKSDGTEVGTVMVRDLGPWSFPYELTNVNGTLFFTASDGVNGTELWRSDGSTAGTVMVKDINEGPYSSYPSSLTNVNGTLFFAASDFMNGTELWKSDGTQAGTVMVMDIDAGPSSSAPVSLTNVNGTLFLSAFDPADGRELWKSDGTAAGTTMVKDIYGGSLSSSPSSLTNVNGTLFFSAFDVASGRELWRSDGTTAGTILVGDIAAGAPSSSPASLAVSGPNFYFMADDGLSGRELWAVTAPLPTLVVNDVTVTEGNTGSTNAVFTVTLGGPVNDKVTVNYGVGSGTAGAGQDFGLVGGTLVFPPGTTTMPVAVPVFGDWALESNETFNLILSAPSGAAIADGTGVGTITNDDVAGLSVADVSVRERTGTTATVTFTVTLASGTGGGGGGSVTVNYATADGTATAPADYQAASGTLTFTSGETAEPVSVTINPDVLVEGMENFTVSLSGESGAAIAHGTATARVLDPPLGGDFNADGNNDLVWRHDVSGQNVIWYMDGLTLLGGTFTTPAELADSGWRIVGTNDFNADGRPDLLWRHRISGQNVLWYMNGAVMTSGTFLTPAELADVNWDISGTGDFNLDGRADILWRHAVSGEIVVWYMGGPDGSVLQGGEFLTPSAFTDLNWQIVGTGDFNLDGRTDILWRHAVAGQNAVWYMVGPSLLNGAFLNPPALEDVNWRMAATGDYNDDGKVDIVWRHSVSGQNVIWFMDGINLTGGGFTDSLVDANWKIVGPR